MSTYEITVKIRVTTDDGEEGRVQAGWIAEALASARHGELIEVTIDKVDVK